MILLIALLIVAALLACAYAFDRAARRRGQNVRPPDVMWDTVKEGKRDARAIDTPLGRLLDDRSWTDYSKRTK